MRTPRMRNSPDRTNLLACFEEDVIPHLEALCLYALRLTRYHPCAENLVQDTLERAYGDYSYIDQGTNIRAWLFKTLTNVAWSSSRGQPRWPRRSSFDYLGDLIFEPALTDWDGDRTRPELRSTRALDTEELHRAVAMLPPHCRSVLVLADFEERPTQEIANLLGISERAVMPRLHRARQLLRFLLGDSTLDENWHPESSYDTDC